MDRFYDDGTPHPKRIIVLELTEEDAAEILTGLCWRAQQASLGPVQQREVVEFGQELCQEFAKAGLVHGAAFSTLLAYPRKIVVRKP